MPDEYIVLGKDAARELRQLAAWSKNFRVHGAASFKNTATGATLVIGPSKGGTESAPVRPLPPLHLLEPATPGGLYKAELYTFNGTAIPTSGGALVPASLGELGGFTCYALNWSEYGKDSHILFDPDYPNQLSDYAQPIAKLPNADDGKPVYLIDKLPVANCTPSSP